MHYKNAPITEALIDIRVELAESFSFSQLESMKEAVSDAYPQIQQMNVGQAQFTMGPEMKATTPTNKPFGLRFTSADKLQVLQVNTTGFAFSRLAPYETWEQLRNEATRLWPIYRESVSPIKITRVAVRYINQFHFPAVTSMEPEDYLNTFPNLSTKLPEEARGIGRFSMSLTIPQNDLPATLVINEALGWVRGPIRPDCVPIILDLDLFAEDPQISGDEDIWKLLEQFRERKNLYFEACITDKTRELIS